MQSIVRGAWTPSIGERLKANEARQAELTTELAYAAPQASPALTVESARLCRMAVSQMETALNDPAIRGEAAEALRSLIEEIVVLPDPSAPDGLGATLYGELATLLSLLEREAVRGVHTKRPPRTYVLGGQLSLVAGTRFELMTFRL